jgi:hypothetical protein
MKSKKKLKTGKVKKPVLQKTKQPNNEQLKPKIIFDL